MKIKGIISLAGPGWTVKVDDLVEFATQLVGKPAKGLGYDGVIVCVDILDDRTLGVTIDVDA